MDDFDSILCLFGLLGVATAFCCGFACGAHYAFGKAWREVSDNRRREREAFMEARDLSQKARSNREFRKIK